MTISHMIPRGPDAGRVIHYLISVDFTPPPLTWPHFCFRDIIIIIIIIIIIYYYYYYHY